jgi:hypothetical protein
MNAAPLSISSNIYLGSEPEVESVKMFDLWNNKVLLLVCFYL